MAGRSLRAEGLEFLAAFIRFARWRAAAGMGLIAAGAIFDGVGLLLLVPILGLVTGTAAGRSVLVRPMFDGLGMHSSDQRLLVLLAGFCALMATRGAILYIRDRAVDRLQFEFVRHVRIELVQAIANAGWARTATVRHARVVQALSEEIHTVGAAANASLITAVSLAVLAGNCVLALFLAPAAGALALTFALAAGLVGQPFLRSSRRLGRAVLEGHVSMTSEALALLGGLKLATAEGLQGRFVGAFEVSSATATRDRLAFAGQQTGLRNLTTTLGALVGAATLFAGVAIFHLPGPVLITLLLVLARMSGPALAVQQGVQQLLNALPAFGALQILERELTADATPPIRTPQTVETGSGLRFEHVAFHHPGGAGAVENLSLDLPAGASIGLAGPSGSGKTTFLDLVAGVLTPQAGRISVHGRALERGVPPIHQAGLAYVAQDPFLFDDTLRRNLLWSRPEADDAELHTVLATVGAGVLLSRLAQGLDTRIGERGVLISAGERQRVALARALLRYPTLLILDEATNAIDVESERKVLEALSTLRPRTTILMAAHRRESLALCDPVLEFPGPRLARGPAADMLKRPSSARR